ncbi:outer membrane beta-barrel protein [Luteibacter sp.]|jgi:OOP family OmpA-OmpF porin/outer membrane immunogenic protein|uniref:outer membrane beta-barrel protein n=1 Tax=Luteibacter sp. TaxID=1886636 RepID=UPI002F3F4DBE
MPKLLLATAVALSAAFAPLAATASSEGAFLGASLGKARYDADMGAYDGKWARAYELLGGYRWKAGDRFAVGVEGGYANLGQIADRQHGAATNKSTLVARAWLIGANGKWAMAKDWSLIGRAGIARTRSDFESRSVAGSSRSRFRAHVTDSSVYLGTGVAYALTPRADVSLQATRYLPSGRNTVVRNTRIAATVLSAGAEFRF